ncbi:DUF1206 domain-containing protein [Mycolicibacterium sp. GCM10028919]|uniref:DUF1206 domain-containing protein n=1 Tax=Mycolicibacterium sp. GCM10028919 TaxID=3273401 RepID=UPI00361CB4F2
MTDTKGAVRNAADNQWFERAARAGFIASGVLHLLLAWIVLRLAFGSGGNADQSGALAALGSQTGGAVMLWLAAIGLAALGLWHVAEAVAEEDVKDKVKAVAVGVVNIALAVSAARFASGSGQSSGQQNSGMSAQLMQSTWGKGLLIIVALVLIGVGGYHVYKGATKRFEKDLTRSRGSIVTPAGIIGYVAKGLVLAGAGILVIVATLTSDPAKASGIDAAVKTLGTAPFGRILLVLAALGIAAYGVFSLIRSRYADMS